SLGLNLSHIKRTSARAKRTKTQRSSRVNKVQRTKNKVQKPGSFTCYHSPTSPIDSVRSAAARQIHRHRLLIGPTQTAKHSDKDRSTKRDGRRPRPNSIPDGDALIAAGVKSKRHLRWPRSIGFGLQTPVATALPQARPA